MNSVRITIGANEEDQEILIGLLSEFDVMGFEQTGKQLIAYFKEDNFRDAEVNEILKNYDRQTSIIEDQNWNEVWESNFQPVILEGFCAIRADFHKSITGVEHEIIITPKMSFGTGHHATTYMMIEQMRDMDFRNRSVLDFGTGTGILAILAEKLGAASVLAIDNDNWSIENAMENIAGNSCSKASVFLSHEIPSQKFDLILANINRNVILEYLPQLKLSLKENGTLLVSGLLNTDEEDIVRVTEINKFSVLKRYERSGWVSVLFANRNRDGG